MLDHFPSLMFEILFERWSTSCRASGSFSRQHRSFPLQGVIAPSGASWHLYSCAFQSDLFENVKCSHENTIRARFPLKHFCSVIINSFNVSCKRNFKRSFIVVLLFMLNQGKKMLVQVMCLLLIQHSLFCKTSQVLFSIHIVKLRDDWRRFIDPSWLNQGQSQNVHEENPSVLQSHTLESSEMLQGLFFSTDTVEKAVCYPFVVRWLWHTVERRGTCTRGSTISRLWVAFWMFWSYKDVYLWG